MSKTAMISVKPCRVTYEHFVSVGELRNMKEEAQRAYVLFLRKLGFLTPEMLAYALADEKGIQTRSVVSRLGLPPIKDVSLAFKLDEKVETELEKFEKRLLGESRGGIKVSLRKCLKDAVEELARLKLQNKDATEVMEKAVETEILAQKRKVEEEMALAKVKEKKYLSIEDVIGKPAEEMSQEDIRKAVIGCPIEPRQTWAEVRDDPEYLCALRLYFPHVTNVDICKYLFRSGVDNSTLGDKFIKLGVKQNTNGRRTLYGLETAAFVDWAGGDIDEYLKKENEKVAEINKCRERAMAKKLGTLAEAEASLTAKAAVPTEALVAEPEETVSEAEHDGPGPMRASDFPEPPVYMIDFSLRGGSRAQLLRMLADIVEEFSEDSRGELTVDYIGI